MNGTLFSKIKYAVDIYIILNVVQENIIKLHTYFNSTIQLNNIVLLSAFTSINMSCLNILK